VPTIRFRVTTDLPPERVLGALTDFSDRRPAIWPNIDHDHFRVHGQGPGWADVTEGNVLAWERNRYDWDVAAGEVTVTAVESNTWGPGSHWRYRVQPRAGGGSQVDVSAVRNGRGLRGMLVAALVGWFGDRTLRSDMEKVLIRAG
jgi:hypothetical protein